MPRGVPAAKKAIPSTASAQKQKMRQQTIERFEFTDEDSEDNPSAPGEDDPPMIPQASGKKRLYEDLDEELPVQSKTNFEGEMQTMLETFGADVRKSLVSKKKRLETFTQQSLKTANVKVDKIWKMQQTERSRLQEEYSKQLGSVLDQWETDINKVKDQEEKIQTIFRQQQKLFQQTRITMSQRLKTVKQLFDQYSKTMVDLNHCHSDQQGQIQGELRKEMGMLQKKILMDTQNQEMANVRKSLQTMFF